MNRRFFILLFCLVSGLVTAFGQSESDGSRTHWYVGVEAGVPFAANTFSSFGADKTRPGVDGAIFIGYRFNNVISLEPSARWGMFRLSARQCCVNANMWLDNEGNSYYAPVRGKTGANYSELMSHVFMQQYGVKLNVNVLGLIPSTKDSRWTAEISPEVTTIGTTAKIKKIKGSDVLYSDDTHWHLTVGGRLQGNYQLNKTVSLGAYTGIGFVMGRHFDGVPYDWHKTRVLWESGMRLTFSIPEAASRVGKLTKEARP